MTAALSTAAAPSRLEEARADLARRTAALEAVEAEIEHEAKRAAELEAVPSLTTQQFVARENLGRVRERLEGRKAEEVAAIAQARVELEAAQREADGVLSIQGEEAVWFNTASVALGRDKTGRERWPGVRMALRPPGVLVSFSGGHLLDVKPGHRVLAVRFKEPLVLGAITYSSISADKVRDVSVELRDRDTLTIRGHGATHVVPLSSAYYCKLEPTEDAPGDHGLVPYTNLLEIVLAGEPPAAEERVRGMRVRLGLHRFASKLTIDGAAAGADLRMHPAGVYAHVKGEHVIVPFGNLRSATLA